MKIFCENLQFYSLFLEPILDSCYTDFPQFQAAVKEKQEIIDMITEAMTAYGYAGVRKQLPNTKVKVKYIGG